MYVRCAYVGHVNEQLVTTHGMNNVIIGGNSSGQIFILLNICYSVQHQTAAVVSVTDCSTKGPGVMLTIATNIRIKKNVIDIATIRNIPLFSEKLLFCSDMAALNQNVNAMCSVT